MMSNRSVLLAASLMVVSGAAFAADLPSRRAPLPMAALPPAFTWTGFYAGINVGGGEQSAKTRNIGANAVAAGNIAAGIRPSSVSSTADGVMAGGQVGYNYQIGNIVLGAEADLDYADLGESKGVLGTSGLATTTRQHLNYLGTVRGRVGYAFDRVLVYGTGGFAYGDLYNRTTFLNAAALPAVTGRGSQVQDGWVAGAGVEYALPTDSFLNFMKSSAVTVKAEYLHYDLGSHTNAVRSMVNSNVDYTSRTETSGDLGRIGINYKFGTY